MKRAFEDLPSGEIIHRVRSRDLSGSVSLGAMEVRHTGVIEGFILFSLTALVPGISNAALGFLTTALTSLATTAIVTGLQFLLMPKPPKAEDGKFPRAQAIPHRIYGIGTNRVAGAYMLWEEKDGVLYSVQALCGHRISAVKGLYLHDDVVTLKDTGFVEDGPNERYGNNKIWIGTRLGAVPETPYAEHVDKLGAEGVWTANCRGDGQASLGMYCIGASEKNFTKYFPYGAPQPSAVLDMALMWDPRDEEQDPDDPATWTFSQNPAVAMIWHQCFNPFGPLKDYRKVVLPLLDVWKEEANVCDELVARAGGGFEKRYECNIWATTETDPVAVENAIMASCDGWRCWRGDGALIFRAGKFREELVATIADADVIGYSLASDVPEEDEVNRLVPKFTYPATDYTTTDTDFFEDTNAQLKAGRVLSQEANFGAVQQWRQARRLGKRTFQRLREKVSGALHLRLSGFNAVYSPWVRLETPVMIPRLNGKVIENRKASMNLMKGGFSMEFNRLPETIEAWDPNTDEGMAPPVPPKPTSSSLPKPAIDTIQAIGLPGGVTIRVSIVDPNRDDLTILTRWRLKDAGGGEPGTWQTQVHDDAEPEGGLIVLDVAPVVADQLLEVVVLFRAAGGTEGPESDIEEIVSTLDETPPGSVQSLNASGGSGQAAITWHAPNSANYVGARVLRNTVNNEGTATLVHTEYGAPSSADGWTDTALGAGSYWYWVQSINGSGVPSSSVATGEVVVS